MNETIEQVSQDFACGKSSPVDLAEKMLDRIDRLNPALNAYITILRDSAIEQARKAERAFEKKEFSGPLQGVPIAIKDLIFIKNVRSTAGSKILFNNISQYDATVITKLRSAGAVILGTTNMHEFASGVTSVNPHFGPVHNPWNEKMISGGSSGGSAVSVSAGMALGALGSDTGGSIRIPSSMCGVVGLKPTFGRVSTFGTIPLSFSLDHVGPITNSVLDAAAILQMISGHDKNDPRSSAVPVPNYLREIDEKLDISRVGVLGKYFNDFL